MLTGLWRIFIHYSIIGTLNSISFKQNNKKQYYDSLICTKNIETYLYMYIVLSFMK